MTEIQLTKNGKRYSRSQRMLFSLLPKDGKKITSAELAARKKRLGKWHIEYPTNAIIGTMKNLMRNVVANKERFRVRKSKPRGPHPSEFWLEHL